MPNEAAERRVSELAAELDLALVHRAVVVGGGGLDGVVLRRVGLDDDAAAARPAAGAAGDLLQELERALAGAEVREVQSDVGGDDADEGDAAGCPAPSRPSACRSGCRPRARGSVARMASCESRPFVTSRSQRRVRAPGKARWTSASTRSVPMPSMRMRSPLAVGAGGGALRCGGRSSGRRGGPRARGR